MGFREVADRDRGGARTAYHPHDTDGAEEDGRTAGRRVALLGHQGTGAGASASLDIRTFTDGEGISRCHLVLGPEVVETAVQPRRAFQGWRYLPADDVPRDLLSLGEGVGEMPPDLRRELSELGLL